MLIETPDIKKAMELLDKGIVLPQKIAAAMRMKPAELRRQMEEASAMDFVSKLTPPSFAQQKEMAEINAKAAERNAEITDKNNQNQNPSEEKRGRRKT